MMLGRERMRAVMTGVEPDRIPIQYQFLGGAHHVLARVGLTMSEAYGSADAMATTQLAAAELFGHDTAMAPWGCLTTEAEAFGCELEHFDMWYPQVRRRPLADSTDLARLANIGADLPDRMCLTIRAIDAMRRRSGDDLFLIAMVVSPFLVACELRGMSQLMLDIGVDPMFVVALLEAVTDGLCSYVSAILSSGAVDAIMFENAGMARELLGPHHVEAFIRPHHQRLVAHARDVAPAVFLIEHNCGASPYFGEIHRTDVDAISFATSDLAAAIDAPARDRQQVAIGMVDHTELLLRGTPDQVRSAALDCIHQAGDRPFVLTTGCEIPFKAPVENILALGAATLG